MHNHPVPPPGLRRRQLLLLTGVVLLIAALAGGYAAYWRVVAQELQAGVEEWAGRQRALGNEITFAWDGIGGFPFRFVAVFRDPAIRWRDERGEVLWRGATLRAEMAPWDLRRIALESSGSHDAALRLAEDGSEWRVTATGLAGTVTLYAGGALRGVTLALQQPDLMLANGVALSGAAATLALDLPMAPPAAFDQPLARLALEAKAIALPAGTRLLTSEPIESLSFDATVKGPMPLAPLRRALTAWRESGGVVELSRFAFAQAPLGLSGDATLALDAELQPEGAGTVTSTGLGEAIEILIRDGVIPPDRALVARATVKALEKAGPGGRAQATLGLTLQNRAVSFGPVPLFALPPIAWPP